MPVNSKGEFTRIKPEEHGLAGKHHHGPSHHGHEHNHVAHEGHSHKGGHHSEHHGHHGGHGHHEKKSGEHHDGKHWIQGAIKHPGAEKEAAKKAGKSTHEYMLEHEHDSGKAGKRARLGLTLEGMHHKNPRALQGAPEKHNADEGVKLPSRERKTWHGEPDGDEQKTVRGAASSAKLPGKLTGQVDSEPDGDETALVPSKMGFTAHDAKSQTVTKPDDNPGVNKPRSENEKPQGPVTKAGEPSLPAGVTETTGAKTTAGDPSFSPIGSANKGENGVHIHIHNHSGEPHSQRVY